MPRIVLHVGAHKTATTYMQKKLAINRDLLASHGIHYDPLEVLRERFTPALNDISNARHDYLDDLRARIGRQDVVISEENIIGMPGDLIRKGAYYADAHERLRTLAKLVSVDRPEIFIALRDYSGFCVSMYSEYLRHREFMTFADYFAQYKRSRFTWMKVIDDIVRAMPNARLVAWDFGRFRQSEGRIFSRMLGIDAAGLAAPEGPVRESFSEKAIQAFEALSSILDRSELKKLIGPISRHLPKSDAYPAFQPLTQQDKATLKAQYDQDLAEIARKYPAIEFIG
jgi:hypothetical protein